jgi:hypothetical protein
MSATTVPDRTARYARLRRFNLGIGLTHLVQAAVLVALSNDLAFPVIASYIDGDPVSVIGQPPRGAIAFEIPVGLAVAVFVAFAAADHLLTAGPLRGWYERKLDQRANYARWIEYSVSSSIMLTLIVALTGIWDFAAVVSIFALNTCMILFGLLMERKESPESADWSAYWFGTFAGIVPWGIIAYILFTAEGSPPTFVYWIVVLEFLLFWSFAMNMALQYAQVGRWRDYIFGEYVYVILSLAAKTLLAWLIFANVLTADLRA